MAAVDRAVWEAAEILLGKANETVPHATGALERSGTVVAGDSITEYVVGYNTPYAVRQHEDTSLNHPDPRNPASRPEGRARWLVETAETMDEALARHVAASTKKDLGA
jgi:hypothetical protein